MGWVRCGLGTPSNILALPTPSEASGAIAQFNTDLTENLLHAVAEFSASQASGTPTPANPIPIDGVIAVEVYRTNKNLLPNKKYERNASNVRLGVDNIDGTIFLKAGTYTISLICPLTVALYYSSGGVNTNLNAQTSGTKRVATFTLSADTELFFYAYNAGGLTANDISDMQLEFGSTATEYEAYNGTTALINLGDTYYGGSVDAVTGKITAKKTKITFDGSSDENWVKTSGNYFYIAVADALSSDDRTEIQSNIIVYATTSATVWGGYLRNGRIYVNTDGTSADANAFKTWLASNNMDVVYPLATPETEYASNSIKIPTLNGLNQVYADSGDVDVTYFETVGHKI